jgi:hypothetical protein
MVLFLTIAATALTAQGQTFGTLSGTVNDPYGAALPEARVFAKNKAKDQIFTAITDASGHFSLQNLPVGTYFVRVDARTLGSTVVGDVAVSVGQAAELLVKMRRGEAAMPGGATGDGHTQPKDGWRRGDRTRFSGQGQFGGGRVWFVQLYPLCGPSHRRE